MNNLIESDLSEPTSAVEFLLKKAAEKSVSFGFAESCTGGLISASVAALPGVSHFFMGSVIAYSNDVKHRLLNVSKNDLQNYGAVSEEVALAMANGARVQLNVDWAVSVTGIAGPDGGSPQKPVGTVCFAVCGPEFAKTQKMLFEGSRQEIQKQSAVFALDLLGKSLV